MVDKKKYILTKINELNNDQYLEIFKIIHKNNIEYTTNSNGVFIDLSNLKKRTLNKIYNYVSYCIKNKKVLKKRLDMIKEEVKNLNNDLNNERSNENSEEKVDQEEYNMTGNKIILKKKKVEYSKTKSKIIKNYNDSVNNLSKQ